MSFVLKIFVLKCVINFVCFIKIESLICVIIYTDVRETIKNTVHMWSDWEKYMDLVLFSVLLVYGIKL